MPPASRGCSYPQGRTWLHLKQGKSRTTAQKGHPRLGLAKDRSQGKEKKVEIHQHQGVLRERPHTLL